MEDQNKNNVDSGYAADDSFNTVSLAVPVVAESPSPDALLAGPGGYSGESHVQLPGSSMRSRLWSFLRRPTVIIGVFVVTLLTVMFLWIFASEKQRAQLQSDISKNYTTQQIPLQGLSVDVPELALGDGGVAINGLLLANKDFVITPSLQPSAPMRGQIYFDKDTNLLAYYNGTDFVVLGEEREEQAQQDEQVRVESIGGLTGQVGLANGLAVVGDQLINAGVLSVGGSTGAIVLGSGLAISNNILQNTGILNVIAGTNIAVSNDGNGNVTISNIGAGTGTVTSSGGTIGRIPIFTGAQNIEDSLISQSGLTVTVSGDLSVVTGGLSLTNALTVSNGGTGASSFAANGVLIGNGTAALSTVSAGAPNLCLLSTAGAPAFAACPSASGVTTLNGLNGAVSVANASGAGGIVTIDNASTSAKGIAQFDATNFTDDGAGTINTVQDIHTAATPVFAGVNTNTITPSSTLTVGATGQQLVLQGSASTRLTVTGGGFTTTIGFSGAPTGTVVYNFDRSEAPGTYEICTTAGNCAGAGAGVTSTSGGSANQLAKFTASQNIEGSTITDDGSTVTTTVNLLIQGGSVTAGATSQAGSLTLHDGDGQTTTLQAGNSSSNLTFILPTGAGTSFQCLKKGSGNQLIWDDCEGGSSGTSGVTTLNAFTGDLIIQGTANQIVVSDNGTDTITIATSQDIATTSSPTFASLTLMGDIAVNGGDITSSGALNITTGGTLTVGNNLNLTAGSQFQINGTQISSANLSNDSNLAKLNASQTFTGNSNTFRNGTNSSNAFSVQDAAGVQVLAVNTTLGQLQVGTANALNGTLVFFNGADSNSVTILSDTLTDNRTLLLPDADGVICTDSGNCAGAGATLQTAYGFSVGGTVPKIKVNSTLLGVDIQDADTTIGANLFNVRQSNASGLGQVMFGVGSTGQVTLQNGANSTTALRLLTSSGTSVLTGDTTNGWIILGQSSTLNGSLIFNNATNGNQITLTTAAATSAQTITLPDSSGTVCLTSGNCAGVGGVGDILQGGNSFAAAMTIGTNDAFDLNLETGGVTRLTVESDGSQVTLASNVNLVLQGTTAYISNTHGFTNSEFFGAGAANGTGSATDMTVLGASSTAGDRSVSVGSSINNTGSDAVALGYGITLSSSNAIVIGSGASASGSSIALGYDAAATGGTNSIALGYSATTTAANQLVIGSNSGTTNHISHVVIGSGVTDTTPNGFVLQGTSGSGSNIAGASVTIAGGQGTGTGNGGSLLFQIANPGNSGSSLNSLSTVLTLSGVDGSASFKNAVDSTAAFRVLNASDVPLFTIDTTNSYVYIGNPSADSTGALLVLDTKNTSGDPSGVNGGMYYNSALGVSRCYMNSYWQDCLNDNPRTSFHAYSDFNGLYSTTTNSPEFMFDGDGVGGFDPIAGTAGHPGIIRGRVSASGQYALVSSPFTVNPILLGNGNTWRYDTAVRVPTLSDGTNSFTVRAGFRDDSGFPAGDGDDACSFKYSHNVNGGRWQGYCADSGTATCDTGITVVANTWYRLTIVVNASATSVDFQVDGVSTCQVTSQIPSTTGNEVSYAQYVNKTAGSTQRNFDIDYIQVLGQFGTPR